MFLKNIMIIKWQMKTEQLNDAIVLAAEHTRTFEIHVCLDLFGRRWGVPPIWVLVNRECSESEERSDNSLH